MTSNGERSLVLVYVDGYKDYVNITYTVEPLHEGHFGTLILVHITEVSSI